MSFGNLPSLGSATGSRVDSAAKHIMACKIDTKLLGLMRTEGDRETDLYSCLHTSKMKWCMAKDEIVLNTSKAANSSFDQSVKAYPMVITTVGDMDQVTRDWIKALYKYSNATEFGSFLESVRIAKWIEDRALAAPAKITVSMQIKSLPDFRCQGVALGQAWASYMSGDTVASVLVGGMVTVNNGAFTMHSGDLVQWYFDWEVDEFDTSNKSTNGHRVSAAQDQEDRNAKRHKYNDERLYGTGNSMGRLSGQKSVGSVVRIKPYRMHVLRDGNKTLASFDHFGDKTRVFAKCISGGRAWDAVDIMLMTQSM
jgi:hypothetical protein